MLKELMLMEGEELTLAATHEVGTGANAWWHEAQHQPNRNFWAGARWSVVAVRINTDGAIWLDLRSLDDSDEYRWTIRADEFTIDRGEMRVLMSVLDTTVRWTFLYGGSK